MKSYTVTLTVDVEEGVSMTQEQLANYVEGQITMGYDKHPVKGTVVSIEDTTNEDRSLIERECGKAYAEGYYACSREFAEPEVLDEDDPADDDCLEQPAGPVLDLDEVTRSLEEDEAAILLLTVLAS